MYVWDFCDKQKTATANCFICMPAILLPATRCVCARMHQPLDQDNKFTLANLFVVFIL